MAFSKLQRSGFQLVADEPTNLGFSSYNNAPMSAIREIDHRQPAVQSASIDQLLKAPRSDEAQALINKYFSVVAQIDAYLAETRAARLADLSTQHDAAVEAARQASASLEKAKEAEFEAYTSWEKLNQVAKNRGAELTNVAEQLSNVNRALLKRSELKTIEAEIAKRRDALKKATGAEGLAFQTYHAKGAARNDAAKAHHTAINNAENISRQIDKLA